MPCCSNRFAASGSIREQWIDCDTACHRNGHFAHLSVVSGRRVRFHASGRRELADIHHAGSDRIDAVLGASRLAVWNSKQRDGDGIDVDGDATTPFAPLTCHPDADAERSEAEGEGSVWAGDT